MSNKDLFGNEIVTDPLLRDKFIEPNSKCEHESKWQHEN